uniref:Glycosyltransferase n=1 Tax=Eiseniibacteriota bacterium TaxID=2212470 RepID=A0A832MME6_UNCEI
MDRVALFARPPVAGRVKTRLSPALPAPLARDLYAALLHDALAALAAASAGERFIYWSEAPSAGAAPVATPPGVRTRLQGGADLGARLAAAFDELLVAPGDRAAIVGADCPALRAAHLDGALARLADADVALGPAADGGYWLIALRRPAPALFRGVAWGSARVLAETLERASVAGLTVATLETLDDLDTPADLARLVARAAAGREAPPARLAQALRTMGLLPPAEEPGADRA